MRRSPGRLKRPIVASSPQPIAASESMTFKTQCLLTASSATSWVTALASLSSMSLPALRPRFGAIVVEGLRGLSRKVLGTGMIDDWYMVR